MGIHKSIYIGPYIECAPKRKSVDFADLLDEALFTVQGDGNYSVVYLAPNVTRDGDPRPDFEDNGEFHLEIPRTAPDAEMTWFANAFAVEIEKLRSVCKFVKVKYGVHQFYM